MKLKYGMYFMDMDNQTMVVPLDSSDSFHGVLQVNETAARIIQLLSESTTEEAIVATLLEEYDAPVTRIKDNVQKLLGILREQNMLEE